VTAGITVRRARDAELDAAGALVADAYLTQIHADPANPYLAFVRDARARALECEVLVAVDGSGALLGCVTYVPGPWSRYAELETADEAGFRMLGVAVAARGRGIGEALVRACIDRARAAGRRGLAISTGEEWHAARRLYERLGFRRDPTRDFDPVPAVHLIAYALEL
jgi:GNAT superfamily N-acetyltransferase